MHILQPKYSKLKPNEVKSLVDKYNISVSQLPKVKSDDPGVPDDVQRGDVLKIERRFEDKIRLYFRVVV